jgi:site-specific DNA-methyltransferase (adenine-specific)
MDNKLIHGDCLESIKKLSDKSINLICIDPPYNIGKDDWDDLGFAKKGYNGATESSSNDEYFSWMGSLFKESERILKDNGSFFVFHNDFRSLAKLDEKIQENTSLVFRQMIVWNKRFEGSPNKGFLDGFIVRSGLSNWNKMAEYILFYTFNNSWKLKEERIKRGVKQTTISQEILSKNGKQTGWYSNIETGKNFPTEETIVPIKKHLDLDIEDIVPKFNDQKLHHSVWNYGPDTNKLGHVTPKPVDLIKNIILHTTDENDVVLDYFGGSGTTAIAATQLNRKFILIEKEQEYVDLIKSRLQDECSLTKDDYEVFNGETNV